MAEYIEREAVLSIVGQMPLSWEYGKAVSDIYDIIKAHPSADVVEVVRCKDCQYYDTACCVEGLGWCDRLDCGMADENFCSYGERRGESDG